MQKFLALYLAPASVLDAWSQTDPIERKAAEEKMREEWQEWMKNNAAMLPEGAAGLGKTKRINAEGTTDVKNDLMLYSIVEADSIDEATKIFQGHPHLQIPEASIEIMPIHNL